MHSPEILWENARVHLHPAMTRAAAALATLFALVPGAQAAAQKTQVMVLPYAVFPGVPEVGPRVVELVSQELRGREELKLVELKTEAARSDRTDGVAQAKAALGKAAELSQKSRHAEAAEALQKAISLLTSRPSALDGAAGQLLADAALQLAVERLVAGDEDGGDAALAQLVRLAPEREVSARDYPPAFLVELQGVRRRLLAAPRGALRVLSPPGAGEAHVFVDGQAVRSAPVLVTGLIPGEHFVRVERAGVTWGEKVIAIAGVETKVAPQPGVDGPAADLTGALLQGELDRAAVMTAGRLARAAGAQAAVFGAVLKSTGGVTVRSFLCLARGDRVFALAPLELDSELLDGTVQMVKLGDEVVAKLASSPNEAVLPLSLGSPTLFIPAVAAAPPPLSEPPSRALVIPLRPTPEDEPPRVRVASTAPQRLQALEPAGSRTREEPPKKNHTVLWIVAGVLVAGGIAAGGYFLYQGSQTPTTATVDATWGH